MANPIYGNVTDETKQDALPKRIERARRKAANQFSGYLAEAPVPNGLTQMLRPKNPRGMGLITRATVRWAATNGFIQAAQAQPIVLAAHSRSILLCSARANRSHTGNADR